MSRSVVLYKKLAMNSGTDPAVRLQAVKQYLTHTKDPSDIDEFLGYFDQLVYMPDQPVGTRDLVTSMAKLDDLVSAHWRFHFITAFYVTYDNSAYDLAMHFVQSFAVSDNDPYRAELLKLLYVTSEYTTLAEQFISDLIRTMTEDKVGGIPRYWYRFITDMMNNRPVYFSMLDSRIPEYTGQFMIRILEEYCLNPRLDLRLRIQCCQMGMTVCGGVNEKLIQWVTQSVQEHYESEGIVGDLYDVMIRTSTNREYWENLLMEYGRRAASSREGYHANSQNVHMFSDQAISFLGILQSRDQRSVADLESDYPEFESYVCGLMLKYSYSDDEQETVMDTLDRLTYDTARIGRKEISSRALVVLLRPYIKTEAQEKVLLEELVDMNGTCTTGHYVRLIGLVASESDTPFSITYEQQIKANIEGRVQAKIKSLPVDTMNMLIEDMIEPVEDRRPDYFIVMGTILDDVYTEMKKEFVNSGLLSSDQFDQWFMTHRNPWEK